MSGFSRGKLEAGRNELGLCTARYMSLKVPVRGRVPYQPIAASRNSFESPSCAEYSAATVIAI